MQYQVNKEIDGKYYTIQQFSPTKSLKLLTRLTKLLGQPMAIMFGSKESSIQEVLPMAMSALVEKLDESSVETLVKELVSGVIYENRQIQFDLHFQGQIGHLFKVLAEVLEVQYGDFLGVLAASGISKAAAVSPSTAQKT